MWSEPNDSEVEIVRNRTQTLAKDPAEARKAPVALSNALRNVSY